MSVLLQRGDDYLLMGEPDGGNIKVMTRGNGLEECHPAPIFLKLHGDGLYHASDPHHHGFGGAYELVDNVYKDDWRARQEASRHLQQAAAVRARKALAARQQSLHEHVAGIWAAHLAAAGGGAAGGSSSAVGGASSSGSSSSSSSSSNSSAPAAAAAGSSSSTPPASYAVVQVSAMGAVVGVPRAMVWAAFEQYWRGSFTGTGVSIQRYIRGNTLQVDKLYPLNAVDGFLLVLWEKK